MDLKFTTAGSYVRRESDFKSWCQEMWYQHCEEIESYTGKQVEYGSALYFAQYKYWLKREYKHQRGDL